MYHQIHCAFTRNKEYKFGIFILRLDDVINSSSWTSLRWTSKRLSELHAPRWRYPRVLKYSTSFFIPLLPRFMPVCWQVMSKHLRTTTKEITNQFLPFGHQSVHAVALASTKTVHSCMLWGNPSHSSAYWHFCRFYTFFSFLSFYTASLTLIRRR